MVKYELWNNEVDLDIPKDVFPTEDELKKMDDVLPGVEHGWFESSQGAQLHYRKFLPGNRKPKGIVVWQHGIQNHSGTAFVTKDGRKLSMALLSDTYTKAGYALYTPDMLGHGFSEGYRFYVPHWKINVDDLDNFSRFAASQHEEGTPLFLTGESYGATCVLHVAKEWQNNKNAPAGFQGIVMTAAAVIGDVPPALVVFVLRRILKPLRPRWVFPFMPNPVNPDRIWKDPEVREFRTGSRQKEMMIAGSGKPFSLGTASNMLGALEVVRSTTIPGLEVPFCACHGTHDFALPIEGMEFLLENAATPDEGRAVLRQEGAFHDMMGDPSAEHTMAFILKWVNDRVEKASK